MLADHRVQPGDPRDPFGQLRPAQHPAGLVLHLDVVVLLGPVVADEQQPSPPSIADTMSAVACGRTTSDLMDKCSRHDRRARHPISGLVSRPPAGARSDIGLQASRSTECSPASGYRTRVCPKVDPAALIRSTESGATCTGAVDQHGQVIHVLVSKRRDGDAARRFFRRALSTLKVTPTEVVTDRAPTYPRVLDELVPAAWHHIERYENNRIEADHGRLKHRLRPMRGLRTDRTAQVIIAGLAVVQNLRRGHYELGIDTNPARRVAAAFTELASAI